MKRRLMAMLAGLGLLGGAASTTEAAPNAPTPAAWVRYAELAGRTFPAWLDEPTPAATRLRDYFDHMRAERGEDVVLPLSVWVSPDGAVSRIAFPVFAQREPNADLQAVFVNRRLSEPPPPGLKLPMRLRLRVSSVAADGARPASHVAGRAP